MISSASFTHTNGWQRSFRASMNRRIAVMRSSTLATSPHRMAWRVMIARNTSTRFIQLAEVGVKCRWILWWWATHAVTFMGVSAVVVEHHVQLSAWVGRGHLLEERQELAVTVPREALGGCRYSPTTSRTLASSLGRWRT
jgi:hypothetical protein